MTAKQKALESLPPFEYPEIDGKKLAEEIREQGARYRRENGMPSIEEEVAAWKWEPNDDWRKLEGILRHSTVDTTEQKHADRDWEIEHDKRKFGSVSSESEISRS